MSATSATLLMAHSYSQIRQKRGSAAENFALTHQLYNNLSTHTLLNDSGVKSSLFVNGSNFTESPSNELTVTDEIILSLHGIIFLLALIGNGLVIATLVRNRRMRTVTNLFLLNLAISDLLLAIVCMPFTIIPVILKNFMFGPVMCILIRYLQGMAVSASAFTLVAISLERFYAICSPLKSRKWQHLRHSYKVLAAVWIMAMVLNIPLGMFQKILTDNKGNHQCTDRWPNETAQMAYYVFHLLIADLLIPLSIMSVAYFLIAKTLWKGFKSMTVVEISGTPTAKAKRQMSLTSDASDMSEDCEIPLSSPLSPSVGTGTPTSPTSVAFGYLPASNGDTCYKLNLPSNTQHKTARSFSRQETVLSLRSHSSQATIRSKKRVIKMLFVIVMEFFVCWTPLYLVYIWIVVDKASAIVHIKSPQVTISMLRLLAYISSCCNPITYCFMSKKFRSAFLSAFRCNKKIIKKPLTRRLASTQVSYCADTNTAQQNDQHQLNSRSKLLQTPQPVTASNGYHGNKTHQLASLLESPTADERFQ